MTRELTTLLGVLLSAASVMNIAEAPIPSSMGNGEELVVWLIRGSISGILLLVVWLFNKGVKIIERLQDDVGDVQDDVLEMQIHLGIDSRREDRGPRARQRRRLRAVGDQEAPREPSREGLQ